MISIANNSMHQVMASQRRPDQSLLGGLTGATSMPIGAMMDRQSQLAVVPTEAANTMMRYDSRNQVQIINPRLSPSTVTSERALEARAGNAPTYRHNVMATRIERTSNLFADAPTYRNQIDILA